MSGADELGRRGREARPRETDSRLAINVAGKDPDLWEKRGGRFYDRVLNSIKRIMGADIPSAATVAPEALEAFDAMAEGALETLRTPQWKNLERQASVKAKLAEAREREASARKLDLESEKLEMEIERDKVLESQAAIDRMIQRGELVVVEKDGDLVFVMPSRSPTLTK